MYIQEAICLQKVILKCLKTSVIQSESYVSFLREKKVLFNGSQFSMQHLILYAINSKEVFTQLSINGCMCLYTNICQTLTIQDYL